MDINTIREKYINYFKEKGHKEIPSASLIPENDPTTLFTGSGMQPLLPYLLGEKHPEGKRLVDSQKAFRAEDIEEVGDNRHTTFFEMLGNWSLGDYFKEEQLEWIFDFLVNEIGLNPEKLYVSVFAGEEKLGIEKDEAAVKKWQELFASTGIEAKVAYIGSEEDGYERGIKEGERIFYYDSKKNWWSRAGVPEKMPAGEPGGPDSEIFYDFGGEHDEKFGKHCHINCDCGRFMEIGNSVFMMYKKNEDGSFTELEQKNIDFGGGLERIAAAKKEEPDVFLATNSLANIIKKLEELSGKSYAQNPEPFRVIADHIRAAVFLIADGALPSNVEQGYFSRRLIRRSILFGNKLGIKEFTPSFVVDTIINDYKKHYRYLENKRDEIVEAIEKEATQFRQTLQKGLKEFEKRQGGDLISADDAFVLFTTYGFPIELIEEMAKEKGLTVDKEGFKKKMQEHKELSRKGAEQKFKGGLADHSEKTTAFHTATHLMLAGLRKYLGEHVTQRGSNITAERARFDFTHNEKVPREILDKVEDYVNEAIEKGIDVTIEEMSKDKAKESGATGAFWEKYPDTVTIYNIIDKDGTEYSRELCGGPHVKNTREIAKFGKFKIKKESSSSAGVRRIKAVFEEES